MPIDIQYTYKWVSNTESAGAGGTVVKTSSHQYIDSLAFLMLSSFYSFSSSLLKFISFPILFWLGKRETENEGERVRAIIETLPKTGRQHVRYCILVEVQLCMRPQVVNSEE